VARRLQSQFEKGFEPNDRWFESSSQKRSLTLSREPATVVLLNARPDSLEAPA